MFHASAHRLPVAAVLRVKGTRPGSGPGLRFSQLQLLFTLSDPV